MPHYLLTGVTGYLGSHLTIQLLRAGHQVTGTLRNLDRAERHRAILDQYLDEVERARLVLAKADLNDPAEKWAELTRDKDGVFAIASPFPTTLPKTDEEIVGPARDGTLAILEAARRTGVPRVVLTSSTGAAVYGVRKRGRFDERDWTDITNRKDTTPYFRSKTIAERAAWDYVIDHDDAPELAAVLPGLLLGPVLEQDIGTSAALVQKLMAGELPALPKFGFDMADVRSVADLHVKAMTHPDAAGERFVASNGYLRVVDVADVLRAAYPKRKFPKAQLPDFAVRLFSIFDPTLKPVLLDLGAERRLSADKARRVLGWEPIAVEEAVRATAESMVGLKLV